jgi:hypothetical protein
MIRAFALTLAALVAGAIRAVAIAAAAHAQPSPTASAGPGQYAVSITAVTALTVPEFTVSAKICVETAAARYTDDGVTAPSATIGIPAAIGCFDYAGPLAFFRIIGAGATLDVSYYK